MRMKLTSRGRAALVNARNTGTNAVIVTEIGVTEEGFVPNPDGSDTALPGERKRISTFGGRVIADDVIHVTVRDETDDAYSLRGIGLYLGDGTLLCVYGQNQTILEKSAKAVMLLSADIMIADMGALQIEFGSSGFLNPPATTDEQGVIELGTEAETIAGKDASRAVTPATLHAALDSRVGSNAPTELAKTLIAQATEPGMRRILGFRDFVPGQVILMATPVPPSGTLLCNGAAVSRADYAELFAAVGTRYGAGDGATTFHLPDFKHGTVPTHSTDQSLVGQYSAGGVKSHDHLTTCAATGDHSHYTALYANGTHSHAASSSAAGDHAHAGWTDATGSHAHGGSTTGDGGHSHSLGSFWPRYGTGHDLGVNESNTGTIHTNVAGHHAHGIGTDWQGNHSHNVGMNGSGNHTHAIGIGDNGWHAHEVDHRAAGAHAHSVTVAPTGGEDNLAAGIRMIYCIAY